MSFGPTIYLTMAKDGTKVPVKACEITSIQEGSSAEAGGPPVTRLYCSASDRFHITMIEVKETPKEIGNLIVDKLTGAKEQISPKTEDIREEIRVR